jgi:hypothetical protein
MSIIDKESLEAININGFDLVMFALNLTVETVSVLSKSSEETEQRLTDLANGLHTFAGRVPEPKLAIVLAQLAKGLIGTEPLK